jgi:hypothetical protein
VTGPADGDAAPAALTPALASRFAGLALAHVTREYPHKLDHVLGGPDDVRSPRALHPVFFGSFDWHSCVHGWWLLARVLRRAPDVPEAPRVRALFDAGLTADGVAGEVAYLERPLAGTFERPYGWAWLLMLAAELARHEGPDGRRWAAALRRSPPRSPSASGRSCPRPRTRCAPARTSTRRSPSRSRSSTPTARATPR